MTQALVVALAYLLGSIPFAFLAGRARGVDLRTVGSGNLGAANVFRTLGREHGHRRDGGRHPQGRRRRRDRPAPHRRPLAGVAAAAAMAGHVFPVWLRFKGGKGVAVGGGAVIALMPLAAIICFAIWVVVVATTRYTSLAAIVACLAATPLAWALGYPDSTIVFAAVGTAAVVFLHRGNIRRLLRGEEHRIELGPHPPPAGRDLGRAIGSPPGGNPVPRMAHGGAIRGGFVKLLTGPPRGWIFVAIDTISAGPCAPLAPRVPDHRERRSRGNRVTSQTRERVRADDRAGRRMAPDRARRLPVGVLRGLRPHQLRHRRGRDVRRGPASVGPRRRHHHRRRLAPHHPWMGDGGHLRHLRRRRHHRRPHQPRRHDRVRDLPRLPVEEGARATSSPRSWAASPGPRSSTGPTTTRSAPSRRRRTADRPRRRRGQHRDIRNRPRRVLRRLRGRVPHARPSAPPSCSSSCSRSSTS